MDTKYLHLANKQVMAHALRQAANVIADPQHYAAECQGFAVAYDKHYRKAHPLKAYRWTLIGALQYGMYACKMDSITWYYLVAYVQQAAMCNIAGDNVSIPHANALATLAKAQTLL